MNIVIDAQVIVGYQYELNTGEIQKNLTGSVIPLLERIFDGDDIMFCDSGRQIYQEYINGTDEQWVQSFWPELVSQNHIQEVTAENCSHLTKKLHELGFPKKHKDIWYIKTARSVVKQRKCDAQCRIVSDDIHLHEPKMAKDKSSAKAKIDMKMSGNGSIVKYLEKKEGISIRCVGKCIEGSCTCYEVGY